MTLSESEKAKRLAAWVALLQADKEADAAYDIMKACHPQDVNFEVLKKAAKKAETKYKKAFAHAEKVIGYPCFNWMVLLKNNDYKEVSPEDYGEFEKFVEAFPDLPD